MPQALKAMLTAKGLLNGAKCLIGVLFAAWLLYPLPYTWHELGKMYPGLEFGQLLAVFWYGYLRYQTWRQNAGA
jgi:hypothetical protein